MRKVGVINYGVGNLGSVVRALDKLKVTPVIINRAIEIHAADSLILPGVGNFTECFSLLDAGDWITALRDEVLSCKRPFLGICVGMQLLADTSTEVPKEGPPSQGLGFIPGRVQHLSTLGCKLRVPHVGWNDVTRTHLGDCLFDGIPDGTDFYFAHSYAFVPQDSNDLLATTGYGVSVAAAVRRGNVWGTQFHPEKSSRSGLQLLRNFIEGPLC